jgi:hypothetical protein
MGSNEATEKNVFWLVRIRPCCSQTRVYLEDVGAYTELK